ncbi:MAG: 1-deoxy-D-xylulose-5-phosphate reductoisomerase [candidate division NC10 bacterium]|nr:1-deoxy-D-xylulose-5-phosphate reductoisomerase [candidate division NC10 bacterium]MDE2321178.1 1-deoxy-D-xylulose-5-phosphate reductoisomerase [candidate division NC10 bacterium]
MKRVSILGSTGTIGVKALAMIDLHRDSFEIAALAARDNIDLVEQQIRQFSPRIVAVGTSNAARTLKERVKDIPVEIVWGDEGVLNVATASEADIVLTAIVGAAGLLPSLAAIKAGKDIALATKEVMVMAGELVIAEARARGVRLLPVDSEHSAIFQCLGGQHSCAYLKRVLLTSSGGPFRQRSKESFASITPDEALRHPTWVMGKKITIDSATLMNKGLEVIEASWFFSLTPQQIDVIIHPQSIIHSMVEFVDGAILAQMGVTDMGLPILYALSFPDRLQTPLPPLDLNSLSALTFEPVDREKFPCLGFAYQALQAGGTYPAVLNAANEVAVDLFLSGRINFPDISALIARAMDSHRGRKIDSLEDAIDADREARELVLAALPT